MSTVTAAQRDPSVELPSPDAPRDPSISPSPPKVKKKATTWVPPPPPPRLKKNPLKNKEKIPPKKLAYEMTDEQLQASVRK